MRIKPAMFVKSSLPLLLLLTAVGLVECGIFGCWGFYKFECANEKCIPISSKCNGIDDCGDGSDELNCDYAKTPASESTLGGLGLTLGSTRSTENTSLVPTASSERLNSLAEFRYKSITAAPDSMVVIQCRVVACEKDGLDWYKPDGELPKGSYVRKGNLIVPKFHCEDSGPYICYCPGGDTRDYYDVHLEGDRTLCTSSGVADTTLPPETASTYYSPVVTPSTTPYFRNGYVYRSPCENGTNCYQFCCNETCVTVLEMPSNTFKCKEGSYVPNSSICNGLIDCPDGSDEVACMISCSTYEFQCGDGKCIPEEQKCDGEVQCSDKTDEANCKGFTRPLLVRLPGDGMEVDCGDAEDQAKSGHMLKLECEFVGRPYPEVRWKKNEGHIPSKCTSSSESGHGILVCPNFQQSDQGAYSCVGENPFGSAESQPKIVVKCKQITCDDGFRVRDELNVETCLKCFCSGKSKTCRSVVSKVVGHTFRFPRTEVVMLANVDGEIFMPNSSNVNSEYLKPIKYCLMPEEEVQGHGFIMSYGRNLNLPAVDKKKTFFPSAPDVIINGGGVMLTYSLNRIVQDHSRMNVRFWNDNWLHRGRGHASRSDIMGVLSHLEQLLIRCEYKEGVVAHDPFATINLESAVVSDESDSVSYVEKCVCPIGYDGLSCELCAPGYKRDKFSGMCIPRPIQVPITCPVGWVGERCDECDVKNLYYMHSKNKTCVKTTCNDKGSMGLFPGDNDECICKEKVTGRDCDTCQVGYFHLEKANQQGCKKCWCSHVTEYCKSSHFRRTTVSPSINSLGGFNESNGGNFWLLPPEFRGNLLTSYGGFIRYTIKYQKNVEKQPNPLSVEILGGNGVSIRFVNTDIDLSLTEMEKKWSVPLEEPFWRDDMNNVVSRETLLFTLTEVKAIFIESPYHLSSEKARLVNVELDVAEDMSNDIIVTEGGEKATKVELCECPVGYEGKSCESCSYGYYRQRSGPDRYVCVMCDCDPQYCDSLRGCAVCPTGKYNNNTNPSEYPVCLDCPCHGNEESCMKDDYNLVLCFCKPGYYGSKCEIGEGNDVDFVVAISPIVVLKKKVGTFIKFNCSYVSAEDYRIEFQKKYAGTSRIRTGLFKVENYGWSSTLETDIEQDLESVDCIVRNLAGDLVARVVAKIIGTGMEVSKPSITNCYDEPKYAMENEDVYLRCDTTGSPEPEVSWYRVDEMGNLVSVNATDGVHTITSVGLDMNGTVFKCVAQNSRGDARCTTLLIVRKRCILSVVPVNPEVFEGESIEFNCSTASGSTVDWSRTDGPLPEESEITGGRLFIENVKMSHMGEYKCTANDPYGPSIKTSRLTVKTRRIPPTAFILQPDTRIVEGKSFTIACVVSGKPWPEVKWTKLGDNAFPENVRVTGDGGELEITNANKNNTGLYECRAESFLNATSLILITVVEKPIIIVQPKEVNAMIGEDVTIDCIPVTGEPYTVLKWISEGNHYLEWFNKKLSFNNIQIWQSGEYTCLAENLAGRARETVRINVGHSPRVTIKPSGIIDAVPRDRLDVECDISGEPFPDFKRFRYRKTNLGGKRSHKMVDILPGKEKHMVLFVTEDLDSIVCEASNIFGTANATLKVNVKSENPIRLGLGNRVRIGSRTELDFTFLGGKINCTRQRGSMIGDECFTQKGLEIMNVQVQHAGTYKCWSKTGEMSYTIKVDGFVNKFTKRGMSYLILPVTVKSHKEFQVEITFRAESQSGFLLVKKKHHAFSMYLKYGKLTVKLRRHSEELILTTKESLQLDVWHTAVFKLRNNAELTVYDELGVEREIVAEGKKFDMNWVINVEDSLYVGGVKASERHLPLRPVDAHFEGCISRLIIDDHEYKMTEEGKESQNVSLCNICTSGVNPCGNESACYDAPTHYGFVCVCGKDGCRKNCMGRGCQTRFNMCEVVEPCGHTDNQCLPNGNGLQCRCANGYSGITCSEAVAFEFGLNGDGYIKLPETYLPRNSIQEPEVIAISFTPAADVAKWERVPLLWQGNEHNFLEIYMQYDSIVYTYNNQKERLQVTGPLDLSNEYRVEITRRNNTVTMNINGDSYSYEALFTTNRVTGDIYIGNDIQNDPSHTNYNPPTFTNMNNDPTLGGFQGCIHAVTIAGKRVNTLAHDVIRHNIQRHCETDNRSLGTAHDSGSEDEDSANWSVNF